MSSPPSTKNRIALVGVIAGLASAVIATLAALRRPPWPDLHITQPLGIGDWRDLRLAQHRRRSVEIMNTLEDSRVAEALHRMYAEARDQMSTLRDRFDGIDLSSATAQERADALSDIYMPVTPEAGRLLYALVRATRPQTVVEFGMSLGLSGIHLASAVKDNGCGRVVTTELSVAKIATARRNFVEAGVSDVITVLEGDALQTLASLDGSVDFVLLDGWKEFYLPVVKLLEPRLSAGTLIVADNTNMPDTQPYLDYVRDSSHGYVSVNFLARDTDSMEISCRV